jgi:hypothetical protein
MTLKRYLEIRDGILLEFDCKEGKKLHTLELIGCTIESLNMTKEMIGIKIEDDVARECFVLVFPHREQVIVYRSASWEERVF